MPRDSFSVLISPTYRCNADCEYCFENKTSDMMTLGEFELLFQRISDYLRQQDVSNLTIYWVGGEIFVMDPEWLLRAHDMIRDRAEKAGITVQNLLQSNLVAYGPRWRTVVAEMFNNSLGSSLDFPNLYRKLAGGTPDTFNQKWYRKLEEAKEAGIQVGIIALIHDGTLSAGAEQFYSYYVEDLGVTRFQINTPYPGGHPTPVKQGFPLDNDLLSAFYSDLFDLWMRRGRPEGISIGPLDELVDYFLTGENRLSCIWGENCANSFIGVSPKGDVGQCEGWVASYPDHVYGNLFTSCNLVDIMNSPGTKAAPGTPCAPHARERLCEMRISGPLPWRMCCESLQFDGESLCKRPLLPIRQNALSAREECCRRNRSPGYNKTCRRSCRFLRVNCCGLKG